MPPPAAGTQCVLSVRQGHASLSGLTGTADSVQVVSSAPAGTLSHPHWSLGCIKVGYEQIKENVSFSLTFSPLPTKNP